MKPTLTRILAASALALGFSACSQETAPPEPPAAQEEQLSEAEKAEEALRQQQMVQAEANAIRALVDRLISDLVNQNFSSAAGQFHFDARYNAESRLREETKLATLFWAIHQTLGPIENTQPLPRGAKELETFGLRLRANTDEYWAEFESTAQARTVMLTQFEKAPSAQIALDLTRDSTGWKVTRFDLGLPVDQEGAEAELQGIAELAAKRLSGAS